jgi:hypothetical protein
MAGFPSGNGSEVLKYTALQGVSTTTQTLITGVTNHIYTVLSVIITECDDSATENFFLGLFDSDGTSNEHIIKFWTPIPASGTFVWNDKFSFSGNKTFRVKTQTAANLDVLCTYIDQDWT